MPDETPPAAAVPDVPTPAEPAAPVAAPPLPPVWRGVVVVIAAPVVAIVGVFGLAGVAIAASLATGHSQQEVNALITEHVLLLLLALNALWLVCVVLGIRWFYRVGRAAIGLQRPARAAWVAGNLLLTVPMFFLSSALAQSSERLLRVVSPGWADWARDLAERANQVVPDSLWSYKGVMFVLLAVVSAPLVEELVFRGLVFQLLRRRGFWVAAMGSSALFSAFHGNPMGFFSIFALALVMAWQRERSGSLLPGMLLHALYNSSQVVGSILSHGRL